MFCQANLGSNRILETFPIGARLAFDAQRGRLLAVCSTCGRFGLEMALHSAREEDALRGELAGLLSAWREAEALAAISDDLLVPDSWESFRGKWGQRAPQPTATMDEEKGP